MSDSERNVNVINGTDSRSRNNSMTSVGSTGDKKDTPQEQKPKRFQNGWTKEQERLMAEWSDIAMCYRWLHDRSDKVFHVKTLCVSLPVIFLSTISGFANIGVQAILETEDQKKYASFAIAGISLLAGLMTTVGDRLRYAQLEESHRVAAIAWGKFQRLIAVELALNPNDRMDSLDFLKICRSDLDRLIEQSPPIPSEALHLFESKFGTIKDLKKPDVCGQIEHTQVYESSQDRLKQLAVEASLMLRRKRQTLNELVVPEIKKKIKDEIEQRINEEFEERKQRLIEELEMKHQQELKTQEEINRAVEERKQRIQEEIELEKKKLTQEAILKSTSLDNSVKAGGSNFESRLNFQRNSISQLRPIKTPTFKPAKSFHLTVDTPQTPQTNRIIIPESQDGEEEPTITIISKT